MPTSAFQKNRQSTAARAGTTGGSLNDAAKDLANAVKTLSKTGSPLASAAEAQKSTAALRDYSRTLGEISKLTTQLAKAKPFPSFTQSAKSVSQLSDSFGQLNKNLSQTLKQLNQIEKSPVWKARNQRGSGSSGGNGGSSRGGSGGAGGGANGSNPSSPGGNNNPNQTQPSPNPNPAPNQPGQGGSGPGGRGFNGGLVVGTALGVGRRLYDQGMGSYESLNDRFKFDSALTDSQRNLARSRLQLGQQLAPYQEFKNNVGAAINRSGAAVPLAIAGDVAGVVGPLLPAAKALKDLTASSGLASKALGAVGKAGLLGAAGAAGGVVGLGVGNLLGKAVYGNQFSADFSDVGKTALQGVGLFGRSVLTPFVGQGKADDMFKAFADKTGVNQPKDKPKNLADEISGGFGYKVMLQRFKNQVEDFQYDQKREQKLLDRSYGRQTADIARNRSYTLEDFGISQQRLAVQRGRVVEDASRQTGYAQADYSRTISRATFDTNKERARSDEDYSRSVERIELGIYRTRRNYAVQSQRIEEDYSRSRRYLEEDSSRNLSRLIEDSTRNRQYLEEDSARNIARLDESTNRQRLRSAEDYVRSRTELERSASRSMADLNRSLGDNLIGILAPGLNQNRGFQIAKTLRDYQINKTRLGEDYQFNREGLELGRRRNEEDISREDKYGREDINRERTRGLESINREESRGKEDIERERARGEEALSIEKSRAEFDLLTSTTDALKDSQLSARDANIEHTRTLADIATNYARTVEDASISLNRNLQSISTDFSRAMQDISFTQSEQIKQLGRSLAEYDLEQKRAAEDYAQSQADLAENNRRFVRDQALSLQDLKGQFLDLGLSVSETERLLGPFNQALGKLPGAVDQIAATAETLNSKVGKIGELLGGNVGLPSHALGLRVVPADGYKAELHQGEMVLTKTAAEQYRRLGGTENSLPGGYGQGGNWGAADDGGSFSIGNGGSRKGMVSFMGRLVTPEDARKMAGFVAGSAYDAGRFVGYGGSGFMPPVGATSNNTNNNITININGTSASVSGAQGELARRAQEAAQPLIRLVGGGGY